MQAVHMNDQCSFRDPSTEVEAQHLIRPLGRCSSDPQADQQARNKGCIHLDAHPVDALAQDMPAAQHIWRVSSDSEGRMQSPMSRSFLLERGAGVWASCVKVYRISRSPDASSEELCRTLLADAMTEANFCPGTS